MYAHAITAATVQLRTNSVFSRIAVAKLARASTLLHYLKHATAHHCTTLAVSRLHSTALWQPTPLVA
jgi:hypothetical protein